MLQASRPPARKRYEEPPAFQVIQLGSSGGPREDNVTGMLIRSMSTSWENDTLVAVDAGTLLGGIIRALELSSTRALHDEQPGPGRERPDKIEMTDGAFEGLRLPHESAESNGAFIFRHLIQSVLITHAHLDHCSALAINSPLVEAETAPKTVSALPSVVAALKDYVFNGISWPNLSDEDGGAGLLTYQRLADGGNPMLGKGLGKGYVKACEGLLTKCISISHGMSKHAFNAETGKFERVPEPARKSVNAGVSPSKQKTSSNDGTPAQDTGSQNPPDSWTAVDSSAFFMLDVHSGAEVVIFGDLEPDSVSSNPRNAKVWREAAIKLAEGRLRGIFVECSYPDAIDDHALFGHMCPRHLVAELKVLAAKVVKEKEARKAGGKVAGSGEKRKSDAAVDGEMDGVEEEQGGSRKAQKKESERSPRKGRQSKTERGKERDVANENQTYDGAADDQHPNDGSNISSRQYDGDNEDNDDAVSISKDQQDDASTLVESSDDDDRDEVISSYTGRLPPLAGLKVFIIHIKEEMTLPSSARDQILDQLEKAGKECNLGCEFASLLAGEAAYL